MFGVNRDGVDSGSVSSTESFVTSTGATFPIGFDLSGSFDVLRTAATGGSSPNSVHVIVDAQGKIAYLTRLFDETTAAEMTAVLERLLAP